MMDLAAEGKEVDLSAITRLQRLKTGALIEYAVEAACIMVKMPVEARAPYRGYARNIGLAFQIADDLIDHQRNCGPQASRPAETPTRARRRSFHSSAKTGRGSRLGFSSPRRSNICRATAARPASCAPSRASR